MSVARFWLLALAVSALAACTRKTVSFNARDEMAVMTVANPQDTLTTTGRKARLSTARKVVVSKEEEKAAKDQEKNDQRKSRKKKKRIFLGERIKRAYVKSGPKGKKQIIEIFYYLRNFQQPNPLAPARYYFDPRKHRIFKAPAGDLDPTKDKVLHGPYKKVQNNQVLETGYFALGVRHLRWEKFDNKGNLTAKTHYEMGFPRDANISYYDGGQTMIKEVVPYVNGKLEGDYVKFTADGKREWTGQFENGRRVGEWTNYWDYKNYRRYVLQYGESGYDPEVAEPELIREYSHGGTVIFDKEKNLDKRGDADPDATPANDPRRPGSHGVPAPKAPVRKPVDRRPGYHPPASKTPAPAGATPPAVPATPGQGSK